MAAAWRFAGLKYVPRCGGHRGRAGYLRCFFFLSSLLIRSYVQYANICAQVMRSVLKEQHRAAALRRDVQTLKMAKWESGKQGPSSALSPPFFFLALMNCRFCS